MTLYVFLGLLAAMCIVAIALAVGIAVWVLWR